MALHPLLDVNKLFFFIEAANDLDEESFDRLNALFALPGDLNARAENVHCLLCLMHECLVIDKKGYFINVFLPWTGLKKRVSSHKQRLLDEFARAAAICPNSDKEKAHFVNIYRNLVSDLFDPYITLVVASYQFRSGTFHSIIQSNFSLGERNKVEFIYARKEFSKLLEGYDARVRNAISHSGSHGVTYKDDLIEFRNITRGETPRVETVTWSVDELIKKIIALYECIISIDAAENVFGIDCLEYIMSDVDIRLQFMYFHTDLQKRQALSANYDLALERLRKDNALTLSQKTDSLSKFLFYNCGLRDMPIKSVGVSESELILIMFVPVSSSDLTKDNEVMGSALRMFRYSILAASIYDSLFTKYRVTAIDENGTPNGLICTTDFELLNKYNMEQAGLVDLLNGSSLHLQDQRITIKVDFEKLTELEQSSLVFIPI